MTENAAILNYSSRYYAGSAKVLVKLAELPNSAMTQVGVVLLINLFYSATDPCSFIVSLSNANSSRRVKGNRLFSGKIQFFADVISSYCAVEKRILSGITTSACTPVELSTESIYDLTELTF